MKNDTAYTKTGKASVPMEIFDSYSKLSTRKREVMSPPTKKRLGYYWGRFVNSTYNVSYDGFRDWLLNAELHANSKKSICHSIGKMMYMYELITLSEFDRLKSAFNAIQPNWSNKVIPPDFLDIFFRRLINRDVSNFYITRDVSIFMVMLITGIRVGQLLELSMEDVELTDTHIVFKVSTSKKNDIGYSYEDKYILNVPNCAGYKSINLRNVIEEYINYRKRIIDNDIDSFICNRNGKKMGDENIRVLCKRVMPEYRITPHSFRHTAISKAAIEHGITKAALLANHSNMNTTKRYIKPQGGDLDDVYRKSNF